MIEVKRDPSPREVRIFGLLWLLFWGAIGGLVIWRSEGLLAAAVILAAAWLSSLIFNATDRRAQLAGALLPLILALTGGSVALGTPVMRVAMACWAVAGIGALAVWASPRFGRRLYVGWMLAALPIGWTLSHLLLALVYYLVVTPIGLVMKLVGYDPMKRAFDRTSETYWVERRPETEASRYFRQF